MGGAGLVTFRYEIFQHVQSVLFVWCTYSISVPLELQSPRVPVYAGMNGTGQSGFQFMLKLGSTLCW